MSKITRKSVSATARKAVAKKAAKLPAKRPPASSPDDNAARIATALEAIAAHLSESRPPRQQPFSFAEADAFVWHPNGRLSTVGRVSRVELMLLKGIDRMRDILIENTERLPMGCPPTTRCCGARAAWASRRW